jgi:hypothetical protein
VGSSRIRVGLVVVVAAVVVAGGVGVSGILGGRQAAAGPSAPPGASSTLAAIASASPTATTTAAPTSAPSSADDELLAQLPTEVHDFCKPTEAAAERRGTIASVRCDLPLSANAETVWYDRFDTLQESSGEIYGVADTQHVPSSVECAPKQPRGQGNWRVGSTHSGRLVCYSSGGKDWIVWSYDAERIVARAVRNGETDADWQGLYDWWKRVSLFLE